jgi:hypothetical protein
MANSYTPTFLQWLVIQIILVAGVLAADFVLKLIFRTPFDGWQAVEMVVFCVVGSNIGWSWQAKGLPFKR